MKTSPYERVFDVAVIGGGISGTMAAVAAAREGKDVILIERFGALGGSGTLGLVQPVTTWGLRNHYVCAGTGKKLLEKMARNTRAATAMSTYGPTCDVEYLKMELERMVLAQNVQLLYYGWVDDVRRHDNGKIASVRVLTKQGHLELQAGVFIDATGDGDVAALCSVPYESLARSFGQQGITLMMVVSGIDFDRCLSLDEMNEIWERYAINKRKVCFFHHPRAGTAVFNMTEVYGKDALDAHDLTQSTIECRKQAWDILEIFRAHMPGFEHAYIEQTAPMIGVRESRRVKGMAWLTIEDVLNGRNFEDRIARASCPVDIHMRNDGKGEYYSLKKSFSIPYRSLIVESVPNLLLTGRCISADQSAQSSTRRMAPGFALGEAAGIAASLASAKQDARSICVRKLQNMLRAYGAVLDPEQEETKNDK